MTVEEMTKLKIYNSMGVSRLTLRHQWNWTQKKRSEKEPKKQGHFNRKNVKIKQMR